MKLIVGKYSGFCLGVSRAVEQAETYAKQNGLVYSYGPLIHNEEAVERLRNLGVHPIDSLDEVPSKSIVIIRSHGVPPDVYKQCAEKEIQVVDVTCPFVARIQRLANERYHAGETVFIAGRAEHPEVVGINGYCENNAIVLGNAQEALRVSCVPKACLIAQTTFIPSEFDQIAQILSGKCADLTVVNTICSSTVNRQKEAAEIAKHCDAVLVVGGRSSSNLAKLAAICKVYCKNVQIIHSQEDLNIEILPKDGIIGVIAGASTPQWSIREVIASMNEFVDTVEKATEEVLETVEKASEEVVAEAADTVEAESNQNAETVEAEPQLSEAESFERDLEKTMVRIRPGLVKKGVVVSITGDDVFVNIGYKADGVIPRNELSTDPKAVPAELLAVGDEVTVEILKTNDGEGNVLCSKKRVDQRAAEKEAIAALADGRVFDVTVKQAVKGGLRGEYMGARVFIPASQVAERFVENIEEFVGKVFSVKALEVDKNRKSVVASRRAVLKEEAAKKRKAKYEAFEAGQRVKGIVRRLTDFGAFTDIGGVDGLIHVTDLSWGRVRHPEDIVKVGDEVEVEILSVDPEAERIALGYKQLKPKPWDTAAERYLAGDIIEGRVDRIAPFGAFVEIEPGLFGLVHISQVATRRIEKVEDELQVGDVITVKVLEVNPENKRISLSRRAVLQEANRQQQVFENKEQKEEEETVHYVLPPMEETTVTLGELFPTLSIELSEDQSEE